MMQSQSQQNKNRTLRLIDLILIGFSGAIGFEIFVLLDYAYFNLAGPDVLIALALAGALNLLIMLTYSELSASMPKVGGEYTYIKTAYGGYLSFIFGCFRWLSSIFAASLAAVTFVLQLSFFFSAFYPQLQVAVLDHAWLISILIVLIMGLFEVRGSKKLGSIIVIAFLILFAVFIIGGFVGGSGSTDLSAVELPSGISGIFAATVYVLPMFIGTRAIIASASSAKRPDKDVPRGILLSGLLIIPIYILFAFVAIESFTPEAAEQQINLITFASERVFGEYGSVIFSVAGMVACLSALGTCLSTQSSISRGMSRDGYLPKILQSVHSRYGTHHFAAIVGTVFIMIISTLGQVPFLSYAASFGALVVFAVVNVALIKLRKTKPYMDRPFKTPFYPLTPILGVIFPLVLIIVPLIIGDGNAIEALTSISGLIGIVLASYFLRMSGRHRIQIALGGIGIGAGILISLFSILNIAGLIPNILAFVPVYIQLITSFVLIVTGCFNFTSGMKKQINPKSEHKEKSAVLRKRLAKRFKLAT